jgi:thymidylate synthase (FAD)
VMQTKTNLLDHGYVKLVECWGSDERIIESARMSTAKGFLGWGPKCVHCDSDGGLCPDRYGLGSAKQWCEDCQRDVETKPGDEKLLKYLWDHQHSTPFEMAGFTVEVKAPIMVFREWHRHRTQSFSEMSARYVPLPDENYLPSIHRLMLSSTANRQAGTTAGAAELTEESAKNG